MQLAIHKKAYNFLFRSFENVLFDVGICAIPP